MILLNQQTYVNKIVADYATHSDKVTAVAPVFDVSEHFEQSVLAITA